MKILKFGGKSVSNEGLKNVISIIENHIIENEQLAIVVSARGNATDELEIMLEKARVRDNFYDDFIKFKEYQHLPNNNIDFVEEFSLLEKTFEGVGLIGDYSLKTKDLVLAQGEILSAKMLTSLLIKKGYKSNYLDSRDLLVTDSGLGNAKIVNELSESRVKNHFFGLTTDSITVITGFIASDLNGDTTTLGRNGSNCTASLLANYLDAKEVNSYTNVDGIFTANPDDVDDAASIDYLTFEEAEEMAGFGANILHAKTIGPLKEKRIQLRILNTFNNEFKGTLINNYTKNKGVKSISVKRNVCVISLDRKGLLDNSLTISRVLSVLKTERTGIEMISSGSSEKGVSLVVENENIDIIKSSLKHEFGLEFINKEKNFIKTVQNVAIVSVIGLNIQGFGQAINSLNRNNIEVLLINNNVNGINISIVVKSADVEKAVNVIHSQIFGVSKRINIAIFGKGRVGESLIWQLLKNTDQIEERKKIRLNIFAVAGSQKLLLSKNGISNTWKSDIENSGVMANPIDQVLDYANNNHLENLIAIDNTASNSFIDNYIPLIENGFDIISSNKLANTSGYSFYGNLRKSLQKYGKQYLYETNVGAGLPLIDTIKLLHASGENITRIVGVFSGSLSFIFNTFSEKKEKFSKIVKQAMDGGYTEPDPREDLCGNDVARKLLILARELDLTNEIEDADVENLIPEPLRRGSVDCFLNKIGDMDSHFETLKARQKEGHVLRYVGELYGDLQQEKGQLKVELVSVPKSSSLGQVRGSDSIFEIYTDSYGANPIVIQGAGAGAKVTARGVFGDLLRIAETK